MEFPNSYIVYDTETTGLDPNKDEVIELSAMRVIRGEPVDQRTWLIKPSVPVPSIITQITGITQDEVDMHGMNSDMAWLEFAAFAGLDKLAQTYPLIGHNIARFDNLFVNWAMDRLKLSPVTQFIDTAAIYKGLKMYDKREETETHEAYANRILATKVFGLSYKLELVYKELGGSMDGVTAHRAAADVGMTNYVYRRLIEILTPPVVPAR